MTDESGHIQPRLLIEDWLPAAAIGVECIRERSTGQQPPHARLHVWWARRPLVASRAAVLGSVLPADFDRSTFERLLGFYGSSEAILRGQELLEWARLTGNKVPNPHGPRAFSNTLPENYLEAAHNSATKLWRELPTIIDTMAGGGSIPLEAARLGFSSLANEYNPVACTVLEATVDYPFRFGPDLATAARRWGSQLRDRFVGRMEQFYPSDRLHPTHTYIYARTVPCPDTQAPTPLVPDWHLTKPDSGMAVVAFPIVSDDGWTTEMRQVRRKDKRTEGAPKPTYIKGKATSIFTGTAIDGDYIKAMASKGLLGSELYAVVLKGTKGLEFRPAEQADRDAIAAAERELERLRPQWEREGIIPTEMIPSGEKTPEALRKGMKQWADMFSPRQLLAMGVLVEELRRLRPAIIDTEGDERGLAIEHLLAFGIDKFANWNAVLSSWNVGAQTLRSVFDRHDFSFKPTFAEMAATGTGAGLAWAVDSALEPWEKLSKLPRAPQASGVQVSLGSATGLPHIVDGSISAVVVDPPYAHNVQYSELADFFYVWLKRTQGHRRPEWFGTYLCDHSQEAVVNAVRHIEDYDPNRRYPAGTKKQAEAVANEFYRVMMLESFTEAHRVLRDDGVLTVMFTHKQQSAWEALFGSLVEAGFVITATWPVRTEGWHSLHTANKNSAESTVILVARKRPAFASVGYFDQDMRDRIRAAARSAAERLRGDGLNSIDQLVGSFGPAMEVFSRYREMRRDTGEIVGVGEAIDEASDAVVEWRVDQLMERGLSAGLAGVEPLGRYVVLCWDVLAAAQFRFNEAKLLGHAVGLAAEDLSKAGLAKKESQNITLLPAKDRRRSHPVLADDEANRAESIKVHPNDAVIATAIDGVHVLALAYSDSGGGAAGVGAARQLVNRHGWRAGSPVARLMHALVLAAPKGVQVEGKGIASKYPEFLAWHTLLEPLFGIDPPDWTEAEPMVRELPGIDWETGDADASDDAGADEEDAEDEGDEDE